MSTKITEENVWCVDESVALTSRAERYSEALQEERSLREKLNRNIMSGTFPTREELQNLQGIRDRVTKLQPHTLRWLVAVEGHGAVQVNTRDKIDWADDESNTTVVVGASAQVSWDDPIVKYAKVREAPYTSDGMGLSERVDDHKMAVEILAANNDWWVNSITRNGEKWDP